MIFYFQDRDNQAGQTWIEADSLEFDQIKTEEAYHISIYHLSHRPSLDDKDLPRYKGSLMFDIDGGIETALKQGKILAKKLIALGCDPEDLGWYLSGKKGIHIEVPGAVFKEARPVQHLPLFHKYIASYLATTLSLPDLDLSLYNERRGKLLRVENKLRDCGTYKVPLSYHEFVGVHTAEDYAEFVAAPREVPARRSNPTIADGLVSLFAQAMKDIDSVVKFKRADKVSDEQFKSLNGAVPICMQQIVKSHNIMPATGRFNSAKMSLARYLVNAKVSDEVYNQLFDEFIKNWESDKAPTEALRAHELRSAIHCMQDQGFSCKYVRSGLENNPCTGCPLNGVEKVTKSKNQEPSEENAANSEGLISLGFNCFLRGSSSGHTPISNFTLKPIGVYYDAEAPDRVEKIEFAVILAKSDHKYAPIILGSFDFTSKANFKKALSGYQTWFDGYDDDLEKIYVLLTDYEKIKEVPKMTSISTIGIARHKSSSRDIDELVWVQPGWSMNHVGVHNTVSYLSKIKMEGSNSEISPCLDLSKTDGVISDRAVQVFDKLINSRSKDKIAVMLGYVSSCWLKPTLQENPYNPVFPSLEIWGKPGAGKTESAKLFACLGGANYFRTTTKNAGEMTPASFRTEAMLSTTVPRILDEVNKSKMKVDRFDAWRSVIKSAGTKQAMDYMGKDSSGTYTQRSNIASTPFIFLGTNHIEEDEVEQRSESIGLIKEEISGAHCKYFQNFRAIEHAEAEFTELAGAIMREALSLDADWLAERMQKAFDSVASIEVDNRKIKIQQVILVGIDFITLVLQKRSKAPQAIFTQLAELSTAYLKSIEERIEEAKYMPNDEITKALNHISVVAATPIEGRVDQYYLVEGTHFKKDISHLHLRLNLIYPHYARYTREQGLLKEYGTYTQLLSHLMQSPSFVGTGMATGVDSPGDWVSLHLGKLVERGIDVSRFERANTGKNTR